MTVKDGKLWLGSIGKEWTTVNGDPIHDKLYWVKEISHDGTMLSHNWKDNFEAVRASVGALSPGYLVHEAVNWDAVNQQWVFLPRRVSFDKYTVDQEALQGSNTVILSDSSFQHQAVKRF